MWVVTDESLNALGKSEVWLNSEIAKRDLATPHDVYGPEGTIPIHFGRIWDTARALCNELCCNMGGGVPRDIIDELVKLSEVPLS